MRRVFFAPEYPPSADTLIAATAAGASEIVQGEGGYVEIPEAADTIPGRLAMLADRRWQASQAVAYAINGVTYAMPCDTQAGTNVLGAIVGLQLASSNGPIRWKLPDGAFADLALSDLVTLGQAMRTHVQACFDNEATIAALITASSDPASVDIDTGWPT